MPNKAEQELISKNCVKLEEFEAEIAERNQKTNKEVISGSWW